MNDQLQGIEVLIWDIDGTLYPIDDVISKEVFESAYSAICELTGWPRDKAIEEFEKIHGKITLSATEAVGIICNVTTAKAAGYTDKYLNRLRFIKRDTKLIALFEALSGFKHFILGNGSRGPIAKALDVLGIARSTFIEIVTSEVVGVNKPKDNGFRYILEKTGLPAASHLMIGDREKVDLMPAKALGMKTCLVWSVKPSMIADVTIPTVYELSQVLI
ncbi:MAG TPA: HAD family hydrolase [Patescibacteria group bacterium]|nr:HAD family hydrolase [Patescibacteria group bacterium]